jgi:hypothetical protein
MYCTVHSTRFQVVYSLIGLLQGLSGLHRFHALLYEGQRLLSWLDESLSDTQGRL